MKTEAAHLPSGSAVDDINRLIAGSICGGGKCSDPIAKVSLASLLGAESELAYFGVKSIGPNDEVEATLTAMLEVNMDSLLRLAQCP
jgi:hypothetical protein